MANEAKPREYSYDVACESLAEYFLGQPRKREDVQVLAQHIQNAVEEFFVDNNGWFVQTHDAPLPTA